MAFRVRHLNTCSCPWSRVLPTQHYERILQNIGAKVNRKITRMRLRFRGLYNRKIIATFDAGDGTARRKKAQQKQQQVEGALRLAPVVAGAFGLVSVGFNRAVASGDPAESRAEVLCLLLIWVLLFTGIQLRSLQAKRPVPVEPEGALCAGDNALRLSSLPSQIERELSWLYDVFVSTTTCRTMFVYYRGKVVYQAGVLPTNESDDKVIDLVNESTIDPIIGPVSSESLARGRGNYIANMVLSPARIEFLNFMPSNVQSLLIQPLGDQGLLILGSDTVRGINKRDQRWILSVSEKVDSTLDEILS